MEHRSSKLFGSLTGDNSDLFVMIKEEEEDSKSQNLEPEKLPTISKSIRSSQSTILNDFSILSYNSKEERSSLSSENTSSEIHATSIESLSQTSRKMEFEDTIEIQMNTSMS